MTGTNGRRGMWRSRWAAIGAAVAVTLGGGTGLLTVAAAGEPSVLVNVTPTRVLDTRIDIGLAGPNTTGVGRLLDVTGTIPIVLPGDIAGSALVVPDNATAIVANLTAVAPTAAGFVSIRPGDATGTPTTSNINLANAGGAVPNAITVPIHTDGTVNLYYFGVTPNATTHLLLDIVGYYQPGGAGTPGPTGPQGPAGATGAAGPQGPAGNAAQQQRLVTITGGPGVTVANETQPSFALGADRLPVIAYFDATTSDLAVVRCTNIVCLADLAIPVESAGTVGWAPSMAIGSDGLPVIAFSSISPSVGIRVRHCAALACGTSSGVVLDNTVLSQTPPSLAIGTDGFPIIAYSTGQDVRTAKCGDVQCTPGLATITTHTTAVQDNFNISIVIGSDGLPVITHQTGPTDLAVTRCANIACTSSTQVIADDQAVPVGFDASVSIGVDGFPVIAHRIFSDGSDAGSDLRITRCTNLSCSAAVSTTVDAVANRTGYNSSIAIGADGVPIIAHTDVTGGVLKISRCTDVTCAAAETIPNDAGLGSGALPSMIIDALGLPAIAHIDTNDIRVTIATNQGWGP